GAATGGTAGGTAATARRSTVGGGGDRPLARHGPHGAAGASPRSLDAFPPCVAPIHLGVRHPARHMPPSPDPGWLDSRRSSATRARFQASCASPGTNPSKVRKRRSPPWQRQPNRAVGRLGGLRNRVRRPGPHCGLPFVATSVSAVLLPRAHYT